MSRLFSVLIALALLITPCGFAHADPSTKEKDDLLAKHIRAANEAVNKNVTFVPTNYENMVKLAWAFGAYKVDDVPSVNRYLQITECNLYHKFFQNEFEWTRILNRTRSYLENYNRDSAPHFYEFVQPIELERYDFKLKGFPLDKRSVYEPTYMIQISDPEDAVNSCGDKYEKDPKYPGSAAIVLKSPFSLSFLHVPEQIAKEYLAYLERQNKTGEKTTTRPAFIRFQVELTRLQKIANINNSGFYVYEGRLISMDTFADHDLLLPLYTQKF